MPPQFTSKQTAIARRPKLVENTVTPSPGSIGGHHWNSSTQKGYSLSYAPTTFPPPSRATEELSRRSPSLRSIGTTRYTRCFPAMRASADTVGPSSVSWLVASCPHEVSGSTMRRRRRALLPDRRRRRSARERARAQIRCSQPGPAVRFPGTSQEAGPTRFRGYSKH